MLVDFRKLSTSLLNSSGESLGIQWPAPCICRYCHFPLATYLQQTQLNIDSSLIQPKFSSVTDFHKDFHNKKIEFNIHCESKCITMMLSRQPEYCGHIYRSEPFICASRTPKSPVDHTPSTGQSRSGAGRGWVSPNCSSLTLALYQFKAAATGVSSQFS